jgi:hypothetical protein
LLVFVLVPVVPLLAAQINYDNLLILLVGLSMLLVVNFSTALSSSKHINMQQLLVILILCLLSSLVKYAYLPVFVMIVAYLLGCLWQAFGSLSGIGRALGAGLRGLNRRSLVGLVVLLVVASGLFAQRYGVNLVRYHTPVPDCGKVLSFQQCSAYGPWIRDYNYSINKVAEAHNPLIFSGDWLHGMWLRLFFAVDGPGTRFETRGPLLVPGISAVIFAALSLFLILRYARRIFATYNASVLALLGVVTLGYIGALWLDNYQAYVQTAQPVAINGRYLLPVLLPSLLFSALAFGELCKQYVSKRRRSQAQLTLAAIAVLSLLWGGGALTYILRSNDAWYWPNGTVRDVNQAVQHTLGPLVPGFNKPTELL